MMQIRSFHKEYWPAIVVRIKIISGMNIAETRNSQDGRISYNFNGRDVDFRVATQPTIHGENIVMRILDKKQSLVALEQLGFSDENTALLKKLLKCPEGIIVITGPTGSGKTTTLYSVLNYINSIEKNIMTLEDPVEYQLPLIRQSNIKEAHGMGFSEGIRSLMRQDPDIIFIGEVRDSDTANMALRAAITGHQVFTTLHTNDALGAIPRLVDIGIKNSMLAGALICIIAQRLTRKLCVHCKKAERATEHECKIMGLPTENPPMLYRHVGCPKCNHKGFKGRIAISEVLAVDTAMDELIANCATKKTLYEHAHSLGFKSMLDDAIDKVLKGIASLEEVMDTVDFVERL
jgi:general secretion pathway protein E/type IV pilus assembly protein PilB